MQIDKKHYLISNSVLSDTVFISSESLDCDTLTQCKGFDVNSPSTYAVVIMSDCHVSTGPKNKTKNDLRVTKSPFFWATFSNIMKNHFCKSFFISSHFITIDSRWWNWSCGRTGTRWTGTRLTQWRSPFACWTCIHDAASQVGKCLQIMRLRC